MATTEGRDRDLWKVIKACLNFGKEKIEFRLKIEDVKLVTHLHNSPC